MYTFPAYLSAQYIDVGMLIGVSNYQGDLAKSSVKASVGRSLSVVGIERAMRMTFTDYLDDVSGYEPYTIARGVPENTDWYFFGGVTFSYNFLFKGMYSSASNSGHLGCPAF